MIHYVKGNLLESNCDYICHQVNCQGVMGSGIAKQIREKWPWVFTSYRAFCDRRKTRKESPLGTILAVRIDDTNRWVVNMFSQDNYGYDGSRFTAYDAFAECLTKMRDRLPKDKTIGFPKNIGCGLGGGSWKVISALIEEILGEEFEVYIYDYAEEERIEDIYPLTIVMDRYNGTYSGGKYTAWNKFFDAIPPEIDDSDIPCMCFWDDYKGIVGRGHTIDEATDDLLRQLREQKGV